MPRIYTPIPSILNSFHRPSVLSIVKQLQEELGLGPDTRVNYPDSDNISLQTGSAVNSDSQPLFPADEKIVIQVEENTNRELLTTNPQYQAGNRFVFRDEPLQVYMKTGYITKDLRITFNYRAPDRVKAERLKSDIEARMSMIREMMLHHITYAYQIPDIFIERLRVIHQLRENVAGYGDDFETWMRNHSLNTLTQLTNTGGEKGYYSYAEQTVRLLGVFDFDTVPENIEKEGAMTPHIVKFEYKLSWQAPVGMIMAYPIMIHNQIMPRKYIYMDKIKSPEDRAKITGSFSDIALSYFERTEASLPIYKPHGYSLPSQDEWRPLNVPASTLRLYSSLIKLDPDNLTHLSRLDELGQAYYINDNVLEFLIGEAEYLNTPGQSVFHVSVYDGVTPLPSNTYYVTDILEVMLNEPANLRNIYHIRLSVYSDLTLITPAARDRLRENPVVLELVLKAISENDHPYTMTDGGVTRKDMEKIVYDLMVERLGRKPKGISVPRTVMTHMIQIRRN